MPHNVFVWRAIYLRVFCANTQQADATTRTRCPGAVRIFLSLVAWDAVITYITLFDAANRDD